MAEGASMGAQPRNLDYYLQRMSGYSKNTIKLLPTSKFSYSAGDTIIWRLPANSIIDLHTLTMKFAAQLTNTGNAACQCQFPRFTQSLIRRLDVTMGGSQVGLGSLHDYGFLDYMMQVHKVGAARFGFDLDVVEYGSQLQNVFNGAVTGNYPSSWVLPAGQSSGWFPLAISSWLGLLNGSFMRFLDTNICPDIEIRISLAPNAVLPTQLTNAAKYAIQNLSMTCESISFGDGSYRAMVDARMSTGSPLMIPFYNWAGFEGSSSTQQINQQFTIGTESLNALFSTIRPGNYDSQTLPQIGGPFTTGTYYIPQQGAAPNANNDAGTLTAISTPSGCHYSWYQVGLSGERTMLDQFSPGGLWAGNYQYNVSYLTILFKTAY